MLFCLLTYSVFSFCCGYCFLVLCLQRRSMNRWQAYMRSTWRTGTRSYSLPQASPCCRSSSTEPPRGPSWGSSGSTGTYEGWTRIFVCVLMLLLVNHHIINRSRNRKSGGSTRGAPNKEHPTHPSCRTPRLVCYFRIPTEALVSEVFFELDAGTHRTHAHAVFVVASLRLFLIDSPCGARHRYIVRIRCVCFVARIDRANGLCIGVCVCVCVSCC